MVLCQINNIKIRAIPDPLDGSALFQCVSPQSVVLEQFTYYHNALDWCQRTYDFVKGKTPFC